MVGAVGDDASADEALAGLRAAGVELDLERAGQHRARADPRRRPTARTRSSSCPARTRSLTPREVERRRALPARGPERGRARGRAQGVVLRAERRARAADRRRARPADRQPARARGRVGAAGSSRSRCGAEGAVLYEDGQRGRARRAAAGRRRRRHRRRATRSPPPRRRRSSRSGRTTRRCAGRAPPARSRRRSSARNLLCRPRPSWTAILAGMSADSDHPRLRPRPRRRDRAAARRSPRPSSSWSASRPSPATRRSRRRPRTRCACSSSPAAATSPCTAGAAAPLVRERDVAAHVHGESGLDGPDLPAATGAERPEHAVDFLAREIRARDGPAHARADRPAHEHRAAARPAPRRAARADRADGRLDRRGQPHAGGRVQHLGRPRGRAARLRERDRHDDDRARRHPPGADHRRAHRAAARRGPGGAGWSPSCSTSTRASTGARTPTSPARRCTTRSRSPT